MTNPNVRDETSTHMQNYSSQADISELGACCLDLLPSTSASTFETTTMQTGMIRSEKEFFNETIGRNSIGYCNEMEELINSMEQLPNDLEEKINPPKTKRSAAKNTFEDQIIDFHYGSVIRDAEIALNEVQSQPGTTKTNKMVEYYSKHCPFILSFIKQEKDSCTDGNGVCNNKLRLKELQRAEDCLDKLVKRFAEILSSCKK